MDKFVEMMQKMMTMSDAERTQMTEKNRAMCICGECPSYNDCAKQKMEALFCTTGRSSCTLKKKACICPICPVTPMIGLKFGYYCVDGSEKELRKL